MSADKTPPLYANTVLPLLLKGLYTLNSFPLFCSGVLSALQNSWEATSREIHWSASMWLSPQSALLLHNMFHIRLHAKAAQQARNQMCFRVSCGAHSLINQHRLPLCGNSDSRWMHNKNTRNLVVIRHQSAKTASPLSGK